MMMRMNDSLMLHVTLLHVSIFHVDLVNQDKRSENGDVWGWEGGAGGMGIGMMSPPAKHVDLQAIKPGPR